MKGGLAEAIKYIKCAAISQIFQIDFGFQFLRPILHKNNCKTHAKRRRERNVKRKREDANQREIGKEEHTARQDKQLKTRTHTRRDRDTHTHRCAGQAVNFLFLLV